VGTPAQPKARGRTSATARILPNTIYRATADIGSKVVSIAFYVVMARMLGRSGFGIFIFGISFASIVTVLAGFGQDAVLTREVARDRSRVHLYFANTLALKVVVALPVIAIAVLTMIGVGIEGRTRVVATVMSVAILLELLTSTIFGVFQAFERLGYLPIVIITQRLFTAAVGIAAMAAGAGVVVVSLIYLAGSLLALGLAAVLLFRYVVKPRLHIDTSVWWPLMRVALPVGVALVLQVTLFRADAVILQIFKSDSVVGEYGAAYRLLESTLFVSWAVAAAVYPVLSRLVASRDRALPTVVHRAVKLAIALTLPVALGAAILAGPVINLLYGDEFKQAARALELLSPTIVLYAFNHIAGVLLLAEGRQRALMAVYGAIAVENIVANFATIPYYSLNAAAANTTISELLLFVALATLVQRTTGGLAWRRIASGPVLAGAASAAVMLSLRGSLALAIALGMVSYLGALVLFERIWYPDDVRTIWRFVRRPGARPEAA
jgi:O-antigen/teichoic acid export membrane protein